MIKQKKGFFLAEETLKMILAVIAIGFLAFLLFSLYNAGNESREMQLATESVDFLMQGITGAMTEVEIFNPEGWVIISWPYEGNSEIPDSCNSLGWDNCICIIEDVSLASQLWSSLPLTIDVRERFRQKSDETGVCRENVGGFVVNVGENQQPIPIENPPVVLDIDYGNKIIREKS